MFKLAKTNWFETRIERCVYAKQELRKLKISLIVGNFLTISRSFFFKKELIMIIYYKEDNISIMISSLILRLSLGGD